MSTNKIQYEVFACNECDSFGLILHPTVPAKDHLCKKCKGTGFLYSQPLVFLGYPVYGNVPRFDTAKEAKQFIESGDAEDWIRQL